jgi:REP-associated tyrosine transposase
LRPQRVHNFGTYAVNTQTWERRALFRKEHMALLLIEYLIHYRSLGKYELHEFVVMPDHLHLLLTPTDLTLERAMQFIKGGFSHRAGQEISSSLEIWQKGFTDHRVRDWEDYEKQQNYIWMNPVKAGLCERPEDFPYGSAGGRYELDPVPQRLKPVSQES